jgi:diguanylate cyclase (GGDEF)-like protein/putative nucleotidyltransferase with HDIG domain
MKDSEKKKTQLIEELEAARSRIAELESRRGEGDKAGGAGSDARWLGVFKTVAQTFSEALDFETFLSIALEKVVAAAEADTGAILILDTAGTSLSLKARSGITDEAASQLSSLELAENEFESVRRWKDASVPLSDVLSYATHDAIMEALERDQVRSTTSLPLAARDQVVGLMQLGSRSKREWSADDLEILQVIANSIAVGVENALLLRRTKELTLTDELTGLYNRHYFYRVLYTEMHRAQRYGQSASLVMLDLDSFKEYNDSFGHTVGDSALRAFAEMVESSLRETDIAFRYGGDEFTLVLPATEADGAQLVADRLRSRWSHVSKAEYTPQKSMLGLSAGIAQFPRDADTVDGLVLLVEAALQNSKDEGGNRSTLASDLGAVHTDVEEATTVDQVYALAATVDARDLFAQGHWQRVADVAETIGEAIGLPPGELADLRAAALLHDIGKVSIPDSVINKAEELTEHDWRILRQHCVEGARIVGRVKDLAELAPVIGHHHEHYDGTGYPDGLNGSDIPLGARIISIADAYDTMTTLRSYRDLISHEQACEELERGSGTQFDPELVQAFVRATKDGA